MGWPKKKVFIYFCAANGGTHLRHIISPATGGIRLKHVNNQHIYEHKGTVH